MAATTKEQMLKVAETKEKWRQSIGQGLRIALMRDMNIKWLVMPMKQLKKQESQPQK